MPPPALLINTTVKGGLISPACAHSQCPQHPVKHNSMNCRWLDTAEQFLTSNAFTSSQAQLQQFQNIEMA